MRTACSRRPLVIVTLLAGCVANVSAQREIGAPAVAALREGGFEQASSAAAAALSRAGENPQALLVRALVRYKAQALQLWRDVRTVFIGGMVGGGSGFNYKYMRQSLEETAQTLAAVERDLALAAQSPWVDLELCPACWEEDWNLDGSINQRDRQLLQVERDAAGVELPAGDPRRTPTFRFDLGDVYWARAMVSFQHAAIEIILAYRWEALDKLITSIKRERGKLLVPLQDKARLQGAKTLILSGLDDAERCRRAYLAETDDDREWVPNPRQKNHALPLPVDDALYQTWGDVLKDVRRLVEGDDGIDLTELSRFAKRPPKHPPRGFFVPGRLFSQPRDLDIDIGDLLHEGDDDPSPQFQALLGVTYAVDAHRSPLVARLARMRDEISRGEDTFERKLLYLFWLN